MDRTDHDGLISDETDTTRCWWCGQDPLYCAYHDDEWGTPTDNDHRLFEKICLEGFQAGLSWLTILKKRENFRNAFAEFDFERVARFNQRSVTRLLGDAGIVRHRGKIESTINNAKRAKALVKEFGSIAAFVWQYEPDPKDRPSRMDRGTVMTLSKTPESTALSKALKARQWTFVGPTTMYAFMQSVGVVNDHLEGCHARPRIERARRAFRRP